ncbi:hypothetical protein [Nocardiopsis metallicus]|uniref:Fatty acid desaturase n=1 Tax=Nocardiopsis metallicus TaxID=179819 RepID=A0A840W380_9ACTN|nr:hypothetical protein [Nocardiopsis metallicus]MBB5491340.1 fatty acid desaturase [Nocardiopsis metallicus]
MDEKPPECTTLTPGPVPARLPQPSGFIHNLRRFTAWLFGMVALTLCGAGIWHADWTYLWLPVPAIVAALVTDPGKGM